MNLAVIVAMNKDRIIGINQDIPWKCSRDMRRFRRLTVGHTLIMGRKTFESLPNGPLPGRRNIVLTRNKNYTYEGEGRLIFCHDLEEAFDEVHNRNVLHVNSRDYHLIDTMPFIIGGAALYKEAIPKATHLYLTLMKHDKVPLDIEALDKKAEITYLPQFDMEEWDEVGREEFDDHFYLVYYRTKWKEEQKEKFGDLRGRAPYTGLTIDRPKKS